MIKQFPYPPHLFEPIRLEIAKNYLKQEFRKYFSALRGKEVWQKIDQSIERPHPRPDLIGDSPLPGSSPGQALEGEGNIVGVRDFWNSFWGVAMGFKLKVGFIQILTAENISWEFKPNLPLDNKLTSGGDLIYIHPDLNERRPRAQRLKSFFQENKNVADEWKKRFQDHGLETEPRDNFPIIVMEETDNNKPIYSVYDGNRRMILAVLENKQTIPAYVGGYKHKPHLNPLLKGEEIKLENFWLPTPFLMELVKEAELTNNEKSYEETLTLLEDLAKLSDSGRYELMNRVLVGDNKFRMKLKKDL